MNAPDSPRQDSDAFISDEELLLRYTQGETGAFETLVRRYRRELFGFLARFVGDRALAEDVFQEAFLQVHLSAGGFDVSRRLKPWLFTIAANKARDALRSRSRRSAAQLDAEIGDEDGARFVDLLASKVQRPDERIKNLETAEIVRKVVRGMPEPLRMVLVLCYFHDFAYKEIAAILGIPLGTVKSRLHVAVKDFARRWTAAYGTSRHE